MHPLVSDTPACSLALPTSRCFRHRLSWWCCCCRFVFPSTRRAWWDRTEQMFNLGRRSSSEGRLRKLIEAAVFGWFVVERYERPSAPPVTLKLLLCTTRKFTRCLLQERRFLFHAFLLPWNQASRKNWCMLGRSYVKFGRSTEIFASLYAGPSTCFFFPVRECSPFEAPGGTPAYKIVFKFHSAFVAAFFRKEFAVLQCPHRPACWAVGIVRTRRYCASGSHSSRARICVSSHMIRPCPCSAWMLGDQRKTTPITASCRRCGWW